MSTYVTEGQQARAYAAYYGLWIGITWIVSFALTIRGIMSPVASNLGLLIGLASLPLAVWLIRGFRDNIAGELTFRRAWHIALMTLMAAAMLTTFAQYIYFAYLDNGALALAYSEAYARPETQDMLRQMMPGQDVDALFQEAMATFQNMTAAQTALQFLFWNIVLANVAALPIAAACKGKRPERYPQHQ